MTRLDVALPDRLRHCGREYRFEGRRGGELDFRCDRDDGRLVLTDAALAEAVATGKAELVQGGPGPDGRTDAAARRVADFAARPARDREEARRRLAYVQGARADGLAGKVGDADLGRSTAATAARLGDADPPCARALRGWLARAGDRPSAARLLANHAGKGNRAPRLAPEVAEAIEAAIDRRYLRRPPISLVALHGFVHAAVDRLNEGRAAKLDVPGYHAVRRAAPCSPARPPRESHEARHGRASADRAFALVRAAPKAAAPLDEVEIDHTLTDLFVICARDETVLSATPHLPIVLRPEPGEDIRGFLRRLAAANGHRSIWTFSQALGLTASFGPASASCQWDRLAEATDLLNAEVAAMRWRRTEPRSVKTPMVVAGAPTVRGFVHPQLIRLCPCCLREDGILRCFWLFWCAVACPRHGTLLSTACRCGRRLLPDGYGRTWECNCGAAARDLEASVAPTSAVEVARNLAARVGPPSGYSCGNSLPAPFDALCAHDYMILLHTLGLVATTPAHEDVPMPKGRRANEDGLSAAVPALDATLARLEAATAALHDWPDAYMSLLERVEARKADAGAKAADIFATPVGRLLVRPMRGADGAPLRILCQAFSHSLRKRRIRRIFWPGRRLSSDAEARRIHKLFNAATLARHLEMPNATPLNRRVLQQVIAGLDEQERTLEAEDLALVVRERATALHRAASTAMSSKAARKAVEGCDVPKDGKALYGWEHPRLLPADPVLSGLCRFVGAAYACAAIEAMLARLRSVARPVERLDGLLPLRSSTFVEVLKPWYTKTSLLLDVVEGRLPVYDATAEAPRLADLHVAADDVRRARSPYSPVWEGKRPSYTGVDRVCMARSTARLARASSRATEG